MLARPYGETLRMVARRELPSVDGTLAARWDYPLLGEPVHGE